MMKAIYLAMALLLTVVSEIHCYRGKIIYVPTFVHEAKSHWFMNKVLVQGLAAKGHDVTVLHCEEQDLGLAPGTVKEITFPCTFNISFSQPFDMGKLVQNSLMGVRINAAKFLLELDVGFVQMFMKNTEVHRQIREGGFSVTVMEYFPFITPLAVGAVIGRPVILQQVMIRTPLEPALVEEYMGTPTLLSSQPIAVMEEAGYTDANFPSFSGRLHNLVAYLRTFFISIRLSWTAEGLWLESGLQKYAPSFSKMWQRVSLLMVYSLPELEYARPYNPNIVYNGGLATKKPQPIADKRLNDLIDNSPDGIVLFTFGSGGGELLPEQLEIFMNAFRRLKQTVIWGYKDAAPNNIPKNVHLFDWLPQTDLLGHHKVKAFLTHGGINGLMEAIYGGVPMVIIPLNGDQFLNARRILGRGYGLVINAPEELSADNIFKALTDVIDKPEYKANIVKAGLMIGSRPHPLESSIQHIEHVMEFGDEHLISRRQKMSFVERNNIDVFGFLSIVLFILMCVVCKCVRLCCASGSRSNKLKSN